MTHRTLTVFVVVLTLAPAAASAQELFEESAWMVTPGLGLAFDPDADVSPAVVAAVGYSVTPTLIVEGELGHLFDLAPDDGDVDSSLTTFHGSVLYFVETPYVVTPYLAGGVGLGHLSHDVDDTPRFVQRNGNGVQPGRWRRLPISRGPADSGRCAVFQAHRRGAVDLSPGGERHIYASPIDQRAVVPIAVECRFYR